MQKSFKQTKLIILLLISLLFICAVGILLASANYYAGAASVSSDFEVRVNEVLGLSLTNCDATNSSVVSVNVTPSSVGTFKSACQTVTVDTNSPGYSLSAKASSSDLLYQNPTTVSPLPFIQSTSATTTTPAVLTNDTWGFAVEDRLNFESSYTVNNATNIFAALPTSDTTIYTESSFPLDETDHIFYYATRLTPGTMAGTYATTVTYTAIGEPIQPVPCSQDVVICVKVTEPGNIAIGNIWSTPITYTINGSDKISIASNAQSTDFYAAIGDVIEIEESIDNVTFRSWHPIISRGFITNTTSTDTTRVSITKMPAMNRFTIDSTGTTAGDDFFHYFAGTSSGNFPGAISSLPDGSFDTSNIVSVGDTFFSNFNQSGALTSLPTGSFNTDNITSTGTHFFHYFNRFGTLVSLPVGSFNISGISSAEDSFFNNFNYHGALTSLPAGSFDTSNLTSAGDYFFSLFNFYGALTSLPAGSFDTSNLTSAGDYFFDNFNQLGKLQTGVGASTYVTITNKSSSNVTFYQRPLGNPDDTGVNTDVPADGTVTYLAE